MPDTNVMAVSVLIPAQGLLGRARVNVFGSVVHLSWGDGLTGLSISAQGHAELAAVLAEARQVLIDSADEQER